MHEVVASRLAKIMMRPYNPAATESNEHSEIPRCDAIGSTEHIDLPHSDPLPNDEQLDSSKSNAIEKYKRLGFFDSGEPTTSRQSPGQTATDELWDILEAETGYSSYVDYLRAYSANSPYLEKLLRSLTSIEHGWNKHHIFTILDLSLDENQTRVVPRCESTSVTSILTNLRQPPANVAVQVVLWNAAAGYHNQDVVNALGLGLKLNPRFLEAVDSRRKSRHLDSRHVIIGDVVATVVRHYIPEQLDEVPIVLIARLRWVAPLESPCGPTVADTIEEDIGDVLPFQYPAAETHPFKAHPPTVQQFIEIGERVNFAGRHDHPNYTHLLKWCLQNDDDEQESGVNVTSLLLKPLVALLYLSIFQIRNYCGIVRRQYEDLQMSEDAERDKIISSLPEHRFRLRAMVEDSKDDLNHLPKYISSQISVDMLSNRSWLKVEEDLKRIHQEASRLETQIRDLLQLQVGEWALQESKKSIELSNRQIEEGKRGQSCSYLQLKTLLKKA